MIRAAVHPPVPDRRSCRATRRRARCRSRGGEPDWSGEWTTGQDARPPTRSGTRTRPGAGADSARPGRPGPTCPVIPRDVDAAGDTLYQTYCAVCHGTAGDAKGPVSSRIGAPSLLTARARAYTDGYLYSIIRYGRGVMPRYGDKVYLPRRPLGDREPRAQAPGAVAGSAGAAGGRGSAFRPAPSATGLDRRAAAMSSDRARPAGPALARRPLRRSSWDSAAGSRSSALILFFRRACAARRRRPRLAALPRQLALLHRASPAAAWPSSRCRRSPTPSGPGMMIRFAAAAVAFLPVSLLGLRADLHGRAIRRSTARCRRRCTSCSTARRSGCRTGSCSAACSSGSGRCSLRSAGG